MVVMTICCLKTTLIFSTFCQQLAQLSCDAPCYLLGFGFSLWLLHKEVVGYKVDKEDSMVEL